MARKTAKEVQGDIITLLKGTPLEDAISGSIYRGGLRPRNSNREDLIVIFTAGMPDQIQTGIITLNLYVPDIKNDPKNGVHVENGKRCEELEILCQQWVESLDGNKFNYGFRLTQTIYTESDTEINQHFIVVKLQYFFINKQKP